MQYHQVSPSAFPAYVKHLRGILGVPQEALARLIGVSAVTVSRWEQAHQKPREVAYRAMEDLRTAYERDRRTA